MSNEDEPMSVPKYAHKRCDTAIIEDRFSCACKGCRDGIVGHEVAQEQVTARDAMDHRQAIFARAVWDATRIVDRPYDALGTNPVKQFADEDGAKVLALIQSAGLVVLDLADEELVERVAHEFWLPLQDYMPGMDKDGWDHLITRIGPKIISALSAATGSAA